MSKEVVLDKKYYLERHTTKIKEVMARNTADYMVVSFLLWEVKEYQYYNAIGFESISAYAEKEFGFVKSMTSRIIKLCENFSAKTKSGAPSEKLAERFEGFLTSQLMEMLFLAPENWIDITPDMSVKQIRELRKKLKEEVATSQLKIQEELKTEDLKELHCGNCGQGYMVEALNKKQWIVIQQKSIGPCCYQVAWDIDLLKKG